MSFYQYLGLIISFIGLIFCLIGMIGILKDESFYVKATASSIIDSASFILITLGIVIYSQNIMLGLKILMVLVITLVLNPLSSHYIVRGAVKSGYHEGLDGDHGD